MKPIKNLIQTIMVKMKNTDFIINDVDVVCPSIHEIFISKLNRETGRYEPFITTTFIEDNLHRFDTKISAETVTFRKKMDFEKISNEYIEKLTEIDVSQKI